MNPSSASRLRIPALLLYKDEKQYVHQHGQTPTLESVHATGDIRGCSSDCG
jgi:hypothetical protein